VDAHTPGAQVEMFSYDHDLEEFVAIGLGTVADDGSVIRSNVGVGVIKAGWHCGAAPGGAGSCNNNKCEGPSCLPPGPPNNGPPDPCGTSGNPINLATGEKYQSETDYRGAGALPLSLERNYASFSEDWQFGYDDHAEVWFQVYNRFTNQFRVGTPRDLLQRTISTHQINNGTLTITDWTPWTNENWTEYQYIHEADGQVHQSVFQVLNFNYEEMSAVPFETLAYVGGERVHEEIAFRTSTSHCNSNSTCAPQRVVTQETNTWLGGEWVYRKKSGETLFFEPFTMLIARIEDAQGNFKTITREGNTTTVTDQFGSQLVMTKNQTGKVISAEISQQGETETLNFTYEYDDRERLIKAIYPDAKFKQYHYESERWPRKLTGITDESGVRYATWQYDNFGRAILSEHALESERKSIRYGTDSSGTNQVATETNELGKQTIYHFEKFDKRLRATKVEGQASTSCIASNKGYSYDAEGNRTGSTDWNGNQTQYEYNDRELQTVRIEAAGTAQERRTETLWHETKPFPLKRTVGTQELVYEYDDKDQLASLTNGLRISQFGYTDQNQLSQIDGPRSDVNDITQFEYDTAGNLVRSTNALGHVVHLQDYNLYNLPTRLVDVNGTVTLLEYDGSGRLIKTTRQSRDGDVVTLFTVNPVGLITQITQSNGSVLSLEYDGARRLIAISNGLGERIEYSIDAMGNRTEQRILGSGGNLTYSHVSLFDELGRMIKDVGTNEQVNTYEYDASGNNTAAIDGNRNATHYAFDPLDRLINSTDANNKTTTFAYDGQDNVTAVTDQRDLVTRYEYNRFNEITKLISPDTGTTTFTYDVAGNIASKTDQRGVVTQYSYDAINRVLSKTYSTDSSRNISYRYDDQYTATDATVNNYNAGKGRLTHISDNSGSTSLRYDDRGNLIGDSRVIKADGVGTANSTAQRTQYHYDLANQLTHIDYPTGIRIHYLHDNFGRVTSLKMGADINTATTLAENIHYVPFGGVRSLTYGNGLELNREYDRDYRTTKIEVGSGSTLDLLYEYDLNNNIVNIGNGQVSEQSASYAYDNLNRLLLESKGQSNTRYDYDDVGNRIKRTMQEMPEQSADPANPLPLPAANISTFAYATDSNRLTTIDGNSVNHDAVGNIILKPQDGQSALSFSYDAVNRLSSVSKNGSIQARYFYNAAGQRVLKQLSDSRVVYHYNRAGQIIGETTFNGASISQQKTYVWLSGMPVAMINGTQVTYIHSDHLNSPRIATNQNKIVVWNWQSDAFGVGAANDDVDGDGQSVVVNLRFPGQVFDAESGKHYNYFRDYDPSLGRYVESDPIGLGGGMNTYSYVNGNSIIFMDRFGLQKSVGDVIYDSVENFIKDRITKDQTGGVFKWDDGLKVNPLGALITGMIYLPPGGCGDLDCNGDGVNDYNGEPMVPKPEPKPKTPKPPEPPKPPRLPNPPEPPKPPKPPC
jgi:RHS repeat-associated protein